MPSKQSRYQSHLRQNSSSSIAFATTRKYRRQNNYHSKKSIFFPSNAQIEYYQSRASGQDNRFPELIIENSSHLWLLLISPCYAFDFFQRVNGGCYSSPHDQIYTIFEAFNVLTLCYGYFEVRERMVFTKDGVAKVWLHEDVFSEKPLLPLESEEAERRYVDSFLKVMREHIFNLQLPVCASSVSDLRRQLRRLAMDYRQNQKQSIKKIQIKLLPSVHGSKCEQPQTVIVKPRTHTFDKSQSLVELKACLNKLDRISIQNSEKMLNETIQIPLLKLNSDDQSTNIQYLPENPLVLENQLACLFEEENAVYKQC